MIFSPGQLSPVSCDPIQFRTAVLPQNNMAATRECFSVEQVIEEVCSSGDTSELQGPQLSVEEVLKLSLENFRSLRPSVVNYSEFQEDVSRQLLNVYRRHEIGVHGTEKVLLSSLPAWPMISCEVSLWLRGVKRRMLANPKARNPWTIEIKRDLPEELFSCLRMSIRGAPSAFGVSVEDTGIKYTHKNRFLRDFSKFASIPQSEVLNNLKNLWWETQRIQSRGTCEQGKAFHNFL